MCQAISFVYRNGYHGSCLLLLFITMKKSYKKNGWKNETDKERERSGTDKKEKITWEWNEGNWTLTDIHLIYLFIKIPQLDHCKKKVSSGSLHTHKY